MAVTDRLVHYRNRVLSPAQRTAGADYVIGQRSSTGIMYTYDGVAMGTPLAPSLTSMTLGSAGLTVNAFTSGSAVFQAGVSTGGAMVKGIAVSGTVGIYLEGVSAAGSNGSINFFRSSTTLTGGASYLLAYQPGTATVMWRLQADNGIMSIPKTKGIGIKVDTAAPTFGWRDIVGQVIVRGTGASDPSWNVYQTNIRQYQFTVNDEIWFMHHIPHDYADGTDLHFHVHWSHASATVTSGSVTWTIQTTYAKGHNQAAFPATKQTTITQTASTTQYQHMIGEVQITTSTPGGDATRFDRATIEPDGLLISRVFLSANSMNGTPEPFMHFADVHYQSTNLATKAKAPDFWT